MPHSSSNRWLPGNIDVKDKTMTTPVLMVVDEDAGSPGTLDAVLRRRYGHDYLVLSEASPATALRRLQELRAAGHEVAVVMAASAMTAAPDFLLHRDDLAHRPVLGSLQPGRVQLSPGVSLARITQKSPGSARHAPWSMLSGSR